jgi:hypothetical protein
VASKSVQRERAPQVPSIYEKLLISGSRAGTADNPRSLQMRKTGVLWGKPQLSHTNNEGKTKAQELKPKRGTKDNQKLFS